MAGEREALIWLRPEHAAVGRPAERSRAEITSTAIELADREGLDGLSMRRLAAALGTGAASLYRYVTTRDDLLDLMTDATAAEYDLPAPTGDWRNDLLTVAHQARGIMRRHPWPPTLVIARPVLGPHGADLLEHILAVLNTHPAEPARKLEAFALLSGMTAMFVQYESAATSEDASRRSAYLNHVAAAGTHPRISTMLTALARGAHDDQFEAVMRRTLAAALS